MNKVINILVKLASDASIKDCNDVLSALSKAGLTEQQFTAIHNLNLDSLKQATPNLPEIKCFPILLPEEREEDRNTDNSISPSLNLINY